MLESNQRNAFSHFNPISVLARVKTPRTRRNWAENLRQKSLTRLIEFAQLQKSSWFLYVRRNILQSPRTPAGNEKWSGAYGLKAPAVIEPSSGKLKSLIFGLRTLQPPPRIEQSLRSEMFEKPTIVPAFN
ncbi:hypothetical protein CEXT_45061 [Caerostris extrusa]|uniref:Uncharacterized protein n=1 Tax=Caerostris extrusa TaxID=172846 RepID=A0AAV4US07_CAEEX|nr:hypothetical protein CEXT_45061 [Caerostris extrusa]